MPKEFFQTSNPVSLPNSFPTPLIIEDVRIVTSKGYITSKEAERLISALDCGDILHPIWEDYSLTTHPSGRAKECISLERLKEVL